MRRLAQLSILDLLAQVSVSVSSLCLTDSLTASVSVSVSVSVFTALPCARFPACLERAGTLSLEATL
eukprot:2774206-Rhodomonas_salina.3